MRYQQVAAIIAKLDLHLPELTLFNPLKRRRESRRKRRRQYRGTAPRALSIECLEPRMMLSGDGLLLANDAYLTLSFASDGVQVAGKANAIHNKFDAIAPDGMWQEAILRAFQTWAVLTNADVGVVSDGGQPFGTPGATRGDARFGDIRIAAIAMNPSIGAVSVPINRIVGGTWRADVVFNTNFAFQSVNDIFEIALHEAGHVFGLDDSSDPNSPLHGGTIPTATVPTATDTLNLQTLFGTRLPDGFEVSGGGSVTDNNSFASATSLDLIHVAGSPPKLLYGDITTAGDLDFYRFDTPNNYFGPITFHVRTSGVSLLVPHLQVFNSAHQRLQEAISTSKSGDDLSITIQNPTPEDVRYFVEVSGASPDLYGVGGYSLTLSFDNLNHFDPAAIASYSDATLRKLPPDQLTKLLAPNGTPFVNDDQHANDTLATAATLQSDDDFATASRFEVVGSISDQTDVDTYRLLSPQVAGAQPSVLTVTVKSLAAGRLVPKLAAYDSSGAILPITILSNGGGELIAQISGIQPEANYSLTVAANDPTGPFNTGNYQLTASFNDQAANFQTFAGGTLAAGTGQNVHTLYVAQPQLFHFLLQSEAADVVGPTSLVAMIYNELGQVVYRLAAPIGEARSQAATLLAPGTYTVGISVLSLGGPVIVPISYTLSGTVLSDPFASDPTDQTTSPFSCPDPGSGNAFCYPGGIMSNDPFLWNSFINSLPNGPPSPDVQTQISLLLGNWWSWFWSQTGVNGPPLAQADSFSTPQDTPLSVPSNAGVLGNDFEPEGGPMVSVLSASTPDGQLQFNPDGSFQYTPAPGYSGLVHFYYQASDFTQLSNVAAVTIAVGLVGDFDHSGTVNMLDFKMWRADFGSTSALAADGNGDGMVDSADYAVWRDRLGSGIKIVGDYDLSGSVDQLDYGVWQQTFGSTTSLAADGNGDGVVDAADYTVWRDHVAAPPLAAIGAAASVATISPALPQSVSAETGPKPTLLASPLLAAVSAPTSASVQARIAAAFAPSVPLAQSAVTSPDLLRASSQNSANEFGAMNHYNRRSGSATDSALEDFDALFDGVTTGGPIVGVQELLAARCATYSKRQNA
jgi:hypothetical protein